MTTTSSLVDDANFWKVDSGSEDAYWTAYEATRPNYADDLFYEYMYTYHSSKSECSFRVAHDVACGSGVAAAELGKRFEHIIASDNNRTSLDTARRRLTAVLPSEKVAFSECTGEELCSRHSAQSADFIAAAESLPLMDAPVALSGFWRILKPGGTLAIWFYGRPHFTEPEYKTQCQDFFDQIMDRSFAKVINGGGTARAMAWKRAADGIASWLDYLDFPPDQWEMVQRNKWNSETAKMGFFSSDACDFPIQPTSNVRETEVTVEKENLNLWKGKWDVQGAKNFVQVSFPNFKGMVEADDEIGGLFEELARAMGGEDAVRCYTWPVVLILATAKKS